MYKMILLTLLGIFSTHSYAGTCSSISRTNNRANTVLTSTKYNADLNTSYSNQNAFDLGCGTDATLELAALNSTEFSFILNNGQEGCKATWSDAATISIGPCSLAIDGNWVVKDTATTVTWGCGSCAAEAASTTYYVYALTTSTGSTLNLLISTTAPDSRGRDGSDNQVLGRFFNNFASDIEGTVGTWRISGFHTNTDVQVAFLKSVRATTVADGTCTAGSFQRRFLNTIEGDLFVTIASSTFTLPAGKYIIEGGATFHQVVNAVQSRIYNDTDTAVAILGATGLSGSPDDDVVTDIRGVVTITSAKTFSLESYCQTTRATDGFGAPGTSGSSEIFSQLKITKLY